jgi:hypothetical protein
VRPTNIRMRNLQSHLHRIHGRRSNYCSDVVVETGTRSKVSIRGIKLGKKLQFRIEKMQATTQLASSVQMPCNRQTEGISTLCERLKISIEQEPRTKCKKIVAWAQDDQQCFERINLWPVYKSRQERIADAVPHDSTLQLLLQLAKEACSLLLFVFGSAAIVYWR